MSREALLAAVASHPDEDAPRLVLADWLDEFGDELDRAHAELIRVQLALERLPPGDDAWAELEARENRLLSRRWDIRERMGNPRCIDSRFARGFPNGVGFDWNDKRKGRLTDDDLADMAGVIDRLPIRSFVGDVLGCGRVALSSPGRSGLELLAAWPHLARLTALEASCGFAPYEDRGDFGPGLRALAASPFAQELRRMKFGGWQLDPDGFAAVLLSPNLGRLTDLDVSGQHDSRSVAAVHVLAVSPVAARLSRLNAAWVDVPADSIALCLARGLLRSLAFGVPENGAGGVGPLLASPGLVGLRELKITGEYHGFSVDEHPDDDDRRHVAHLSELLASPELAGLESLAVLGVALGDGGVKALAEGPVGRSLVELDLRVSGLTGEGLRALRPMLSEGRLRRLSIDHSRLTRAAATELASWPEFGRLHRLNVGYFNHLEDEDLEGLRESPHRHPWLHVS